MWSPRWYDYTMACAPPGKEGIFGALALAPVFAAKLPTGLLGGYLLQTHCPADAGGDCPHSGRGATVGGEVGGEVGGRGRGRGRGRGWDEMRRSGAVGYHRPRHPHLAGSHSRLPPMAQGQRRRRGETDGETDGGGGGGGGGFVRRAIVGGKTYERLERAERKTAGNRGGWV